MRKIGVVGDRDSVLFFKALGFEVFPVAEAEVEANRRLIDRLAREGYGAIFITEQVAATLGETMEHYERELTPAIIPIPSNTGSLGIGLGRIQDNVEKAVGINILE